MTAFTSISDAILSGTKAFTQATWRLFRDNDLHLLERLDALYQLETEQALTGTASKTYTGIPAGTRRITVMFDQVSKVNVGDMQVQIGDAGGIETTGYISTSTLYDATATWSTRTDSFHIPGPDAAIDGLTGHMVLTLMNATNKWCASHTVMQSAIALSFGAGVKSLSAELTQITITNTGAGNFDAGSVNILIE